MTSASRRPEASVTRVCQTMVVWPRCRGRVSARTTPSVAPAKKLVFDSRVVVPAPGGRLTTVADRKSTRLNSSHDQISYAVFCLKKKNTDSIRCQRTDIEPCEAEQTLHDLLSRLQ